MTRVLRAFALFLTLVVTAACSGSDSPTAPSPTPTPAAQTRIIGVSGNLAFGEVAVGSQRDATFTITNTGLQVLTVTGLSVSGGLADHTTATWTSGQVAAGGSQAVTVRFAPTTAGVYSGTLSVNADQTSGTSTIGISGTGAALAFTGNWSGTYIVERCDGTGSVQDIFCSQNRGVYPVGSTLPITMNLQQNGNSVSGVFALGQVRGAANGTVSAGGVLTLQGTATSGSSTATIVSWNTRVQGTTMEGNITYNATVSGVPGVATVVTRIGRVTR